MTTTICHDMIHKDVEVYVDNMMVKSDTEENRWEGLKKFQARAERYNLRLNPKKCIFGVAEGELLGHIVRNDRMKIDPNKVKAISEMPVTRIETKVRGITHRPAPRLLVLMIEETYQRYSSRLNQIPDFKTDFQVHPTCFQLLRERGLDSLHRQVPSIFFGIARRELFAGTPTLALRCEGPYQNT
ncbi:uncharacterized protein LOC126681692 [Mercurialis annua]|uniref:uncharacterized protein LOC126681692 n=1 Tax=Mercurialis annua TaxID=3986 RepID=UPI002160C671|nr:uncharacterized protein LOC126681692 [Mercurialis annua]